MADVNTRVVLLRPPLGEHNNPVRFGPVLLVCPVCLGDYVLGTSELLYCDYSGSRTGVAVCRTCHTHPPNGYTDTLVHALDHYEWSQGREVRLDPPKVATD